MPSRLHKHMITTDRVIPITADKMLYLLSFVIIIPFYKLRIVFHQGVVLPLCKHQSCFV
jgi:hypothetical protein